MQKATDLDCGVCGPNSWMYYKLLVMSLGATWIGKKIRDLGMNTMNSWMQLDMKATTNVVVDHDHH